MSIIRFVLFTLMLIVFAPQMVHADFEPTYKTGDMVLERFGAGVLKYMGVFRVYDGAFYLPPQVNAQMALEDVAKRLEVKYLRSFKAKDFGPATITGIKKNVDPKTYQLLSSRIAYHNTLYEDISTGDRVCLTYLPSIGTQVEINGKVKGTIEGADFAVALFSMWIGDNPFDAAFKRALLGGNNG